MRVIESEHDISRRYLAGTHSEGNPISNSISQEDAVDTDSGVNMETGPLSLQAPTQSRPMVVTICNPLKEGSSNRQNCPSDFFCAKPNPVQVPWVKGSTCM